MQFDPAIDKTIDDLVNSLRSSDPYKIVLFGSYAKGNPSENSDMDIMVILDNDDVARTYKERLNKYLSVQRLVREINYKIALDILVYSKEEFRQIKDYGNVLIDEIEKTGKIVYEKAS
jgi:predicted nucleotidyltransferase